MRVHVHSGACTCACIPVSLSTGPCYGASLPRVSPRSRQDAGHVSRLVYKTSPTEGCTCAHPLVCGLQVHVQAPAGTSAVRTPTCAAYLLVCRVRACASRAHAFAPALAPLRVPASAPLPLDAFSGACIPVYTRGGGGGRLGGVGGAGAGGGQGGGCREEGSREEGSAADRGAGSLWCGGSSTSGKVGAGSLVGAAGWEWMEEK
jgi:hypothetical protein